MKTRILTEEEPFADLICFHLRKEFPGITTLSTCELVEALSNEIIGTKEVRYGSLPIPESLVIIREAIRDAIKADLPIPILVPWGSIKANFSKSLDIAEVSAIQRLVQLQNNIKSYYKPGAEIVIRVEDTSAYTLFSLENDGETNKNIDSYSGDMQTLVNILSPADGSTGSIRVLLESSMPQALNFNSTAFYKNQTRIYNYLRATRDMEDPQEMMATKQYDVLRDNGWKGYISKVQREHYLSNYRRIYDWDEDTNLHRLSLYFAGAWRRFQLNMTGKQEYWDKFIQLNYTAPIKGLPEGYGYNTIYYRTLPLSEARTHMSPWRSKGYLKINGNTLTHKLTTWTDTELISRLTKVDMVLSNEDNSLSVIIEADYLLEA